MGDISIIYENDKDGGSIHEYLIAKIKLMTDEILRMDKQMHDKDGKDES